MYILWVEVKKSIGGEQRVSKRTNNLCTHNIWHCTGLNWVNQASIYNMLFYKQEEEIVVCFGVSFLVPNYACLKHNWDLIVVMVDDKFLHRKSINPKLFLFTSESESTTSFTFYNSSVTHANR